MTSSNNNPQRKIAIPLDLSDESAFVVEWALQNYLRAGDSVTLIHIRATSVLYGADWGSTHFTTPSDEPNSPNSRQKKLESDFDKFTEDKMKELAQPLVDAKYPIKMHIVKDHDMKERLCLEIERLGMSAVIMGSRGFGASGVRDSKGSLLGSVSDYCVHHCVCPVVVIRFPENRDSTPPNKEHSHKD